MLTRCKLQSLFIPHSCPVKSWSSRLHNGRSLRSLYAGKAWSFWLLSRQHRVTFNGPFFLRMGLIFQAV